MPRNAEDARRRLEQAALELFAEYGFEQTTAAQIASRAGVTERTFFRHFPDKREVLFEGQEVLSAKLTEAIAQAPAGLPPLSILHQVFASLAGLFEANRPFSEPRQRIIAANPALQEREVGKHAVLVRVVAEALHARGVERQRAGLAAQTGLAALSYALDGWFADPSRPLRNRIDAAFAELGALAAPLGR